MSGPTHRCQGCGAVPKELHGNGNVGYYHYKRGVEQCGPVLPWPSQEQELLLRCWGKLALSPTAVQLWDELRNYLRAAGLIDEQGERIK